MYKYKKSILSIAAALAMSSTILSANYIPLTSTTNDGEWVLFGAAGFQTDGTAAGADGVFRITGATNTVIDTALDDIPVSGLYVGTDALAMLDSYDSAVPLEVRVDITGVTYAETEPFRTMYVDTNGDGAPNFAFTYKASLEGKTLEYTMNGGSASTVTIDYTKTFNNPIAGVFIVGSAAVAGTTLSQLNDTNSVLDWDFADNPPLATQYDDTLNHDNIAGGDTLRLYQYNAIGNFWEIFDTGNTAGTNDFDALTAGKGYWGKMTTTNLEAGVVMGTPGLTSADYVNAELRTGWNLMSFDGVQSSIRHATTGLLLTTSTSGAAATFTLTDSTGNHDITIAAVGAGDSNIVVAKTINTAVEQAKADGSVPYTFDLRAFPTENAGEVALVSTKKFTVTDGAADELDDVSTLAGQPVINTATGTVAGAATADANTTGATSVYGEYSMVIAPLMGAGTAQAAVAGLGVMDVFGATNPNTAERVVIGATGAATATAIIGTPDGDFTGSLGLATAISLDMVSVDHVLMSSVEPFKIRDTTFSRVYEFNEGTTDDGKIQVDTANNITITKNAVAATGAAAADGDINTATGNMPYAVAEGDNVVIISNVASKSEFTVYEYGDALNSDIFTQQAIGTDLARGSVKEVYSLEYLAKKELEHVNTIVLEDLPNSVLDTVAFNFVTPLGTINGTPFSPHGSAYEDSVVAQTPVVADQLAAYDAYVEQINTDLAANGLTATAAHDYAAGALNSGTITITGTDVINVTESVVNDAVGNAEVFTVTYSAAAGVPTGETLIFDGVTTTLLIGDTTAALVAAQVVASGATANWTPADNGDGTVTWTANAVGEVADVTDVIGAGTFTGTATAVVDTEGGSVAVETAATIGTPDTGFLGTLAGDLATDLRYNQILSPNYVMDGPHYTMRDNNLTLKALVTGTMNIGTGVVGWDSIDLTRLPSEWLDSQDYDLFAIDARAGYWAYLEEDATVSTLAIGNAVLSKNYVHHFDENGDTYNSFSGIIDVEVTGISTLDAGLSARVTATINGKTVELVNSAGTTSFTGTISTNEINGLAENTAYEVYINVADGLGAKVEKNFTTLFDNQKPVAPTVTINAGTVSIAHTDTNVTGFYVFGGIIPEVYTAGDELAILTSAGDVGVVCEEIDAVTATSTAGGLTVIAIDQNGTLGNGNASDSQSVAFMPILKSRYFISDSNVGADVTPTANGNDYNVSCSDTGPATITTGVLAAAITTGTTVKLAYTSLGEEDILATPITEYLSDGTNIMRITYPDTYTGDDVFVQLGGIVYGYVLTGVNSTSGTPTNISGLLVKTGITLD